MFIAVTNLNEVPGTASNTCSMWIGFLPNCGLAACKSRFADWDCRGAGHGAAGSRASFHVCERRVSGAVYQSEVANVRSKFRNLSSGKVCHVAQSSEKLQHVEPPCQRRGLLFAGDDDRGRVGWVGCTQVKVVRALGNV